jgi:hypothetical protein
MKKLLWPLLLLFGLVLLLLAGAYFYEQRWGIEGPFPPGHHHH